MKILMLLGSPHKNGTTATLVDSFVKGAQEKNHKILKVNCNDLNVHPCIGCDNCLRHGICVWTDDMFKIEADIKSADAIVFVTPVYYFGMTAQLKLVLDRFYSFNNAVMEKKPKFALITAAADSDIAVCEPVVKQIQQVVGYYGAPLVGMVNAVGCSTAADLDGKDFVAQAYELAKSF